MHGSPPFPQHYRKRLLRAAQGAFCCDGKPSERPRLYRCFPLHAHHIRETQTFNPSDFHKHLCHRITKAERRVYLASLYVGPAASRSYQREVQLLESLRESASRSVDIRILMDRNRALRKIPRSSDRSPNRTITSAEACYAALQHKKMAGDGPRVYLLSVLPAILQTLLPNPYNEVAGVFHVKAYIIDDELILSGANLSEEYFSDRVDRYLWLKLGANGLVDCYADLFNVLCHHANIYDPRLFTQKQRTSSITEFMDSITSVLSTTDSLEELEEDDEDDDVVAYAIPTFQAPAHYYGTRTANSLPQDVQVVNSLFVAGAFESSEKGCGNEPRDFTLRLSTAYLNLTESMRTVLSNTADIIYILTAGKISHGFKRKEKAGNKGKEWITSVFDTLARRTSRCLKHSFLWFYQRPGWSFHAKGMWLSFDKQSGGVQSGLVITDPSTLVAVTNGSSNYGRRSARRDMESNVIMILKGSGRGSEPTTVQQQFCEEWNLLSQHAVSSGNEERQALSWMIRLWLPWIRSFF